MARFKVFDQSGSSGSKLQVACLIDLPRFKNGVAPTPISSISINSKFVNDLTDEDKDKFNNGELTVAFVVIDIIESDTEETVRQLCQARADREEVVYLSTYKERGSFLNLQT